MTLQEDLIARYILSEAAAEQIIHHEAGGYVFHGEKNDYLVELKLFPIAKEKRRLTEGDTLGYN